jgi:hypothetical protein
VALTWPLAFPFLTARGRSGAGAATAEERNFWSGLSAGAARQFEDPGKLFAGNVSANCL